MTVTVGSTLALFGFRPRLFFGDVGSEIGFGGLETSLPLLVILICFLDVASFMSASEVPDGTTIGPRPAASGGVLGAVDGTQCSAKEGKGPCDASDMRTSVGIEASDLNRISVCPFAPTCSCWCQSEEVGRGCVEIIGPNDGSGDVVFCLFLRSWLGSTSQESTVRTVSSSVVVVLLSCIGGRVNRSRDAWFFVWVTSFFCFTPSPLATVFLRPFPGLEVVSVDSEASWASFVERSWVGCAGSGA